MKIADLKIVIKPISFVFWLLFALTATCLASGDDWKPVSAGELVMRAPMVEKDADAEALFWEVKLDDDAVNVAVLSNYVRVKVFTDRGREKFKQIDIPAEFGDIVKDVRARVIHPNGLIVELNKSDIFERTIVKFGNNKLKAQSFVVPELAAGDIVEYQYREAYRYGIGSMTLLLQREIPVQAMTFAVRDNYEGAAMHILMFNVPDEVNFVNEKGGVRRLTLNNVRAFQPEPQMPPIDQIRPWVFLYYADEGGLSIDAYWKLAGTDLYEQWQNLTKPSSEIKAAAEQIGNGASTPEEKLARLYDYCQTKIKNLSFDNTLSPEEKAKIEPGGSPAATIKRQAGWGPDVDILFAALVRASGIGAEMAWTGDRSHVFFDRTTKSSRLLEPDGVAVKLGDGYHFFQPGARFVPFGMLSWNHEGQDALIPDQKGAIWAKTPVSGPERSQVKRRGKFRLLEDGTLEGQVRIEYTGQFSYQRKRDSYEDSIEKQEETLRDEIKARLSSAELTDIQIENLSDPQKPLTFIFNLRVPGYAQPTGKRLLLQPGVFEHGASALFTSNERRFDVYFHFPWSETDDITIELPAGFSLDNPDAPAPVTPDSTKGICGQTISMGISRDQRTLGYRRSFFFGGNAEFLFSKANYPALKDLFDRIHLSNEHTIILRRP